MADLTDFLLARIAEDETAARRMVGCLRPGTMAHRLLAESEAKRRLAEYHRPSTDHRKHFDPYCVGCWEAGGEDGAPSFPCHTIRIVAAVHADHPGYRDEWKP